MKLFKNIMVLLAMGTMLVACKDDDSVDYTQYYGWRDQNSQLAIDLLKDIRQLGDAAYFTDSVPSLAEPFAYCTVYRVLQAANQDSLERIGKWYTPYYTSTLKTHYTLYDTKSVMQRFQEQGILDDQSKRNDPELMNKIFGIGYRYGMPGYELKADTLESSQVAFFENFNSGGVIKGWGDCLQRMHIGDSWLISIPWFLGYGQAGSGNNIDPYSNLYFRVTLVDITSLGENK